jgi:hypothetical protein
MFRSRRAEQTPASCGYCRTIRPPMNASTNPDAIAALPARQCPRRSGSGDPLARERSCMCCTLDRRVRVPHARQPRIALRGGSCVWSLNAPILRDMFTIVRIAGNRRVYRRSRTRLTKLRPSEQLAASRERVTNIREDVGGVASRGTREGRQIAGAVHAQSVGICPGRRLMRSALRDNPAEPWTQSRS